MSDYESALLETWQRKPDAIPVLLSDNLRKEREIAALREQLATTASDGDQTLTMLVNAQNEALLAEVERLTQELARAEAANTAVIRANAEEIADLEDVRDDLEANVNALSAQVVALREAGAVLAEYVEHQPFSLARLAAIEAWRAALAAAGREGQRAGDNDRG